MNRTYRIFTIMLLVPCNVLLIADIIASFFFDIDLTEMYIILILVMVALLLAENASEGGE